MIQFSVLIIHEYNFRFIRNSLSIQAAKVYFHSLLRTHVTYCIGSNAHRSTIKPLESLYKQALKVFYHHCPTQIQTSKLGKFTEISPHLFSI